jgi:phosphomannomutase
MSVLCIACDLDGTLAASKSAITPQMARMIEHLLLSYDFAIISWGWRPQFQKQVVAQLTLTDDQAKRLHLLPTCGTQYRRRNWTEFTLVASKLFPEDDKENLKTALIDALHYFGLYPEQTRGELVEDRITQISLSPFGQQAPLEVKEWRDHDGSKREKIINRVAPHFQAYSFRSGWTTTIDITLAGIDKTYAIDLIMQDLQCTKEEILFFWDMMQPWGNDYPVMAYGVPSRVTSWPEKTLRLFKEITWSKTVVITSGYFNPLHPGHIECFELCKQLWDELRVIVNNDKQAQLKTGSDELFQNEEYRIKVVSALKMVDRVMLAVDTDWSVCASIQTIAWLIREHYGPDVHIIFWKWWDRFTDNIPEVAVCRDLNIQIVDWLWAKIDNSSVYRAKRV